MKLLPVLAVAFRRRKLPVGTSWRMDATYLRISGLWTYLYRAVDGSGDTINFLMRAKSYRVAAQASFERAIGLPIEMRQSKHLNNLIEQDYRAVKRITRRMTGFESFRLAGIPISSIEVMHMIRKCQLREVKDRASPAPNHFYSLAF